MMDSWIHLLEEPVPVLKHFNERVCTFCDRMAVVVVRFGSYSVHLCEGHTTNE